MCSEMPPCGRANKPSSFSRRPQRPRGKRANPQSGWRDGGDPGACFCIMTAAAEESKRPEVCHDRLGDAARHAPCIYLKCLDKMKMEMTSRSIRAKRVRPAVSREYAEIRTKGQGSRNVHSGGASWTSLCIRSGLRGEWNFGIRKKRINPFVEFTLFAMPQKMWNGYEAVSYYFNSRSLWQPRILFTYLRFCSPVLPS